MRIAVLLGMLMLGLGLARADQFVGWLSDAKCAKTGKDHTACAKKCVEGGEAVVLVTDDHKVYKIKNQERVKNHAGEKVQVDGTLEGDTLTVEKGRPAPE